MCSNNLADASSIIIDFTPQGSDPGENGDDFIIIDYKLADIEDCSFVIDWRSDADVNVSVGGQDSIWIDIGAPLVERAASGLPAVQDVSTPTDMAGFWCDYLRGAKPADIPVEQRPSSTLSSI